MTGHFTTAAATALLLAACGSQRDTVNASNVSTPGEAAAGAAADNLAVAPAAPAPAVAAPAAAPEPVQSQRPLGEAETALAVARQFGDLLSAKKYDEALAMWKDGGSSPRPSSADFAKRFAAFDTVNARAAPPSHVEGAAGSLYADVPLTLTGLTARGEGYRRSGTVTLKRVNGVPGATPEQLRWHIIDVKL